MTARHALGAALAVLLLMPAAAAGHPGARPGPPPNLAGLPHLIPERDRASYHSQVLVVRPQQAGLKAEVLGTQDTIEIVWKGKTPLVVVGRYGEPMFRLTQAGVEVNERSPTVWQAVERFGRSPVPADADGDAAPRWRQLDSGAGPWRWQDPRIQWRRAARPAAVGDGAQRTRIRRWSIPVRIGDREARVEGALDWIPSAAIVRDQRSHVSEPLLSALVLLVAMALGAWLGVLVRNRRIPPRRAHPSGS